MKINPLVSLESIDTIKSTNELLDSRNTSYFPYENKLLNDINTPKIAKNEILISSIKAKASTINEVLGKTVNYNDDIYIFEIEGKTYTSATVTWKIYKNNKQVKELFEQIKKEISKRENPDETMINKCKVVKNYTNGEIYRQIDKIAEDIMHIYNNTNPNQPESLKIGLKISKTSFYNINDGIKAFEGFALKKAEPRVMRSILKYILFPIEYFIFNGWNKRWIVLKKDMISYLNNPNTLVGKNVYWFDEDFKIATDGDKILKIKNLSRTLELKFDSKFERDLWNKEIESRVEIKKNAIMDNLYHSFTTQKINCGAKWFVDADSYFAYLLEHLKKAKETVYVTDWFMSPELALSRPLNYDIYRDDKIDYKKYITFNNVSRLMDVFYLLAKRGVKIYILLFSEVKRALANNSQYTKSVLQGLHENIKVTRHPKRTQSIFWSHHEKLVIIDQKIAFVGGLDLCWGRYDTNFHPIVEEENKKNSYYYPGSDYVNERQVDLHEVEKYYKEQIDRKEKPRMAWHDIHTMVEGPIVSDIVRHFVERWNDARFNKRNNALVNVGPTENKSNKNKISINNKNNINNNIKTSQLLKKQSKTLKSKDINMIINLTNNFENIKEEENDDEDENRKSKKEDEKEINNINNINNINSINSINSINDNIISNENENENMKENENDKEIDIDNPLYKVDEDDKEPEIQDNRGRFTLFSSLKNKVKSSYEDYKSKHGKEKKMKLKQSAFLTGDYEKVDENIEMDFKIQALRSVSQWSIGKTITERSILEGYYKLIDNAKHYIYIENQFFVTKSYSEDERKKNLDKLVENEIGLHIRARIERAYEEKTNFKVFICIPLLPGFSGTPGDSSTMNCILKHTYQSICHNKGMSLLEKLKKKMGDDVNKYIYFFSLRNHGTIKGNPVTELIYVHSKLLIVDDEKVLIGSANINDRSMTGYRDSEFAVIVEEDKKKESIMDGKKFIAANYALTLRKHLMAEHFGLNNDDKMLDDPLNSDLWNLMRSRANVNSAIYSDIFDCFPDNKFNNFAKLRTRKKFKTKEDMEKLKADYNNKIIGVVGHIVEYPIEFLKDEELDINFLSKENFLPEKSFV